jgi:methanogenic corrinoid protein MtbC1
MDESAKQLSRLIENFAAALAEYAVTRHAEIDPDLPERYGRGWRSSWVGDVKARLSYLAQAIAVRQPSLFLDNLRWTRTAFAAREVATEDLRNSLVALREVLEAELPESASRVALPYVVEALDHLEQASSRPPTHLDGSAPRAELLLRYLEAVLEGRREDAVRTVLEAAEKGASVRELYEQVLQPAQAEIGRMWHLGEISIADEHFATATAAMTMSRLRAHFPEPPPSNRRMIAAAVGGDLHEIGVRMVADFFEMEGWSVYCIGANVPVEDLVQTVRERRAHLLALSAGTSLHLRTVGEAIGAVRADPACDGVRILVGGAAFAAVPDAWKELGADGYAGSASQAVALAERLLSGR